MDLSCLTSLLAEKAVYQKLREELPKKGGEHRAIVWEGAKPYLVACLFQHLTLPTLVITASGEKALKFQEELRIWCGNRATVLLFPQREASPYEEFLPDIAARQQRLQVLTKLREIKQEIESPIGANQTAVSPPLLIASAPALAVKTISFADFASVCHTLQVGKPADPLELLARWRDLGYKIEDMVEIPGTASRRGGILDIYPPYYSLPLRIEFFGKKIESLRLFDPATQCSLKPVLQATIVPAEEHALPNTGSILDYLPSSVLLILDEPADIEIALQDRETRTSQRRSELIKEGKLGEKDPLPYFSWSELAGRTKDMKRLLLQKWQGEEEKSSSEKVTLFSPAPLYGGKLTNFLREVKQRLREGYRLVIISQQAHRLAELWEEEGIFVSPLSDLIQPPAPGSLALVLGSFPEGWAIGELILLTDAEIFGWVKQRRAVKKRPVRYETSLSELTVGSYVVHSEHGIARFAGFARLSANEAEQEYLVLEYAAGDKLYVPTDQVDRVSRYIGSGGEPPTLTRLGSAEWEHLKQRVKEGAKEMAQELLSLYASRQVLPGYPFSSDTLWQQELESSFPYVETPDQWETIQEVKQDMEKPQPMDRLVCGDVGYGKTEIALRAAFKAVMDGKQVAMLVPTTVLAQQHFATFSQRLAPFPLKVEMLSRFRSEKEQEAIIRSLAEGAVDICIGTHRLLQKDVVFKDLGLVIIDEEHRFGVVHKERLKQLRKEIDVLTLSATPIPRTLYMSLSGIRDMSLMGTPPEERLPVKTYVGPSEERLIKEAITRELKRQGQVFLVHNRIHGIFEVARRLRELVPQARIAIGHGRMPEEKLEKVMLDFSQGKVDVLLCTTIIEAGLDIPNANTLVVNDSHKLGLAQLYQLRGRVGRGNQQAYAYFFYPKGKHLTQAAEKRLQTIFEAIELGAGFRLALKDLEIRGAGNLLGAEQSGHIAAVGFDLYCQILSQAVEELKAKREGKEMVKPPPRLPPPVIDLRLSAYISADYVPQLGIRLSLYHRLAKAESEKEVQELAQELQDRFGRMPTVVENLLYIVKIRLLAARKGVQSISTEDNQLVIRFWEGLQIDPSKLEQARRRGLWEEARQLRLDLKRLGGRWRQVLEEVLRR